MAVKSECRGYIEFCCLINYKVKDGHLPWKGRSVCVCVLCDIARAFWTYVVQVCVGVYASIPIMLYWLVYLHQIAIVLDHLEDISQHSVWISHNVFSSWGINNIVSLLFLVPTPQKYDSWNRFPFALYILNLLLIILLRNCILHFPIYRWVFFFNPSF